MRIPLAGKKTIVKLLDSQHRGIGYTTARVELLRQVQVMMPELALVAELTGRIVHVQLEMLDFDDLKMLSILNASASAA